jgi:molybdopterin synthase catalytic subunit
MKVKILDKNKQKVKIEDLVLEIKKDTRIDECGAIITFEGIVRGIEEEKIVKKLTMSTKKVKETENKLKKITKEIKDKFKVIEIGVVHYFGEFFVGDSILLVVVSSSHRTEGLGALKEIIERIKDELDFKKEEHTDNGTNIIMSGG